MKEGNQTHYPATISLSARGVHTRAIRTDLTIREPVGYQINTLQLPQSCRELVGMIVKRKTPSLSNESCKTPGAAPAERCLPFSETVMKREERMLKWGEACHLWTDG